VLSPLLEALLLFPGARHEDRLPLHEEQEQLAPLPVRL
jgi:hypothetical protein